MIDKENPVGLHAFPPEKANPLFFLGLLQCFLMQHLTCNIQVQHVTKSIYNPFKIRLNVFIIVITLITILACLVSPNSAHAKDSVYFMLVVTILSQWHFILHVIYEMADTLGIYILRIKNRVSNLCLIIGYRRKSTNLITNYFPANFPVNLN